MTANARNHLSAISSGWMSPDFNDRNLIGAVISGCQYYFDYHVSTNVTAIDPTLVPAFAPCSTAIGRLIAESGQLDIGPIDTESWMRGVIASRFSNYPNLADYLNTIVGVMFTTWNVSTDAPQNSLQTRERAVDSFKACSEWYAVNDNMHCGGG